MIENIKSAFSNLSDREKNLIVLLSLVGCVLVIFAPVYWIGTTISDVEEDNQELQNIIDEIESKRVEYEKKKVSQKEAEARYKIPAPPLGSFLEAEAKKEELTIREVVDQPEKNIAPNYIRKNVRASFSSVGLRSLIRMMANVRNSSYPIALERIHIDHFSSGDQYNAKLGVIAYSVKKSEGEKIEPDKGLKK